MAIIIRVLPQLLPVYESQIFEHVKGHKCGGESDEEIAGIIIYRMEQ